MRLLTCVALGWSIAGVQGARAVDYPLVAGGVDVQNAQAWILPIDGSRTATIAGPLGRVRVTIEVVARFDCATSGGGSSWLMDLEVNGVRVADVKDRAISRLVNRELYSRIDSSIMAQWYGRFPDGRGGWRLMFEPSYANPNPAVQDNPFRTIVDVTDLIDGAGPNSVRVLNTGYSPPLCARAGHLFVETLLLHDDTTPPSLTLLPHKEPTHLINSGTPARGAAEYEFIPHDGGGFSLQIGTRVWDFTSAFSYPNVGINRLLPSPGMDGAGQAGWKVIPSSGPGEVWIDASGPSYEVHRRIVPEARKISVEDTIVNIGTAPLGMLVRNEVGLSGLENAPVRLAGSADTHIRTYALDRPLDDVPSGNVLLNDYYAPTNPTVYVEASDHGIGLVAGGKIFRNQVRVYTHPGRGNIPQAGLETDMLLVPAGGSQTLEWAVYPVDGVDYFDFINLVRDDWGANLETRGPWLWGWHEQDVILPTDPTVQNARDYHVQYVVQGGGWTARDDLTPPRKLGFGSAVMGPVWARQRERIVAAVELFRSVAPDAKVLLYFDEQRDSNPPGGFQDSIRTTRLGTQEYFPVPNFLPSYGYVPVSGPTYGDNSFGGEMLAVAEKYMSELGADGLYCDEMEAMAFGDPQLTFNRSDGFTVDLDPSTFTPRDTTVGLTQLLSEEHRLELITTVRKAEPVPGGTSEILGNGPTNLPSLLATGIQRMVEAQQNDLYPTQGTLQTPLAYLAQGSTFAHIQRLLTFGLLPVGTISTDWPAMGPAMAKMFPLTPIELHMGYILGVERVITAHSGLYGWPGDGALVEPYFFDVDGSVLALPYTIQFDSAGAKTEVALATTTRPPDAYRGPGIGGPGEYSGQLAILEKLPVTITGEGTLTGVTYAADELHIDQISVTAPHLWVLKLHDGRLPITPGAPYDVLVGTVRTTKYASNDPNDPVLIVGGAASASPVRIRPQ